MRTGHKHLKRKETNTSDKERTAATTQTPLGFLMLLVFVKYRGPQVRLPHRGKSVIPHPYPCCGQLARSIH